MNSIPIQYSNHDNKYNNNRRISCCSYCHEDNKEDPYGQVLFGFTPPLENIYYIPEEETKPFSCIYLLNLFLAPDMKRYLQETGYSDDVYDLPIHLQRLICEAKMETMISKQETNAEEEKAYQRLLKLKHYVDNVSHQDVANIIHILNELVHDDDELITILGE